MGSASAFHAARAIPWPSVPRRGRLRVGALRGRVPRRMGTQDPWFASFYPGLVDRIGAQYSRTRLSDSAVFALTGLALLGVGIVVVG